MQKVNKWLESIQNTFFPPCCLLCGDNGHNHLDLCQACHRTLPWLSHTCPRCSLPLAGNDFICGTCLNRPPAFDGTKALWHYRPPVTGLITALKFRGRLHCARLMGELFATALPTSPKPDVLVPVPLHPQRYRQRGFNQSLEIALYTARRLSIPLRPRLCRRIRPTPPQHQLDARHRQANLRGAFQARGNVNGLRIAIFDDVMTTGTTANEVAATLKRAGANSVEIWVLARA